MFSALIIRRSTNFALLSINKQKTQNNPQPDEVQIPQPDLRIVSRKQSKQKPTAPQGRGPNKKNDTMPQSALSGHSTHQCRLQKHAIQTN